MFHHREDRIRAHVQLCWLALLLIRVVENATGDTWRNTRHELDRMHLVTLATADGRVAQRSTTTAGQKTILAALDLPEPPRFLDFTPFDPRGRLTAPPTPSAVVTRPQPAIPRFPWSTPKSGDRVPIICGSPAGSRWTMRRAPPAWSAPVAAEAQSDCVEREFDRLGHLGKWCARGPLRHLGLQVAGGRAECDDDEYPRDRVPGCGGAGVGCSRVSCVSVTGSRRPVSRRRAPEPKAKGRRSPRASPHSWDGTVSNPSAHVTGCDQREFNRYECANRLLTNRVSHAGENRAPVARTLLCEPTGKCT